MRKNKWESDYLHKRIEYDNALTHDVNFYFELIEKYCQDNPEILEKIENLGELLERGALTREEFDMQKKRILNGE